MSQNETVLAKRRRNAQYRYRHDETWREKQKSAAKKYYNRIKPQRLFTIYGYVRPSGVKYYVAVNGYKTTRTASDFYDTLDEAVKAVNQ